MFKGPDTNVDLHVLSAGCPEIRRVLAFRDWLRTHEDDRLLYERTRRELARRSWTYVQNYADAKTEVVETITAGHWRPGTADAPRVTASAGTRSPARARAGGDAEVQSGGSMPRTSSPPDAS